jgi:hypothetical protein
MNLLKEIKQVERWNGLEQAKDDANSWYSNAKGDPLNPEVQFLPNNLLQLGKIHSFKYNPKGKDVLAYYDRKPVMLHLGQIKKDGKVYEFGVNLNFIPIPYKWYILDKLTKVYAAYFNTAYTNMPEQAKKQISIPMSYNLIKALLRQYNVKFAFRMYIPSRKSDTFVMSYKNWNTIAFLDIEKFEGISYEDMIREYTKSKYRQ